MSHILTAKQIGAEFGFHRAMIYGWIASFHLAPVSQERPLRFARADVEHVIALKIPKKRKFKGEARGG